MPANFDSPPSQQQFSVPYVFVLYMAENPLSPEVLKNFYQTCKFFFTKNQTLFIASNDGCFYSHVNRKRRVMRIPASTKMWLTGDVTINPPPCINLQYFHRITPNRLIIGDDCTLSIAEFDMLVAENTIQEFSLRDSNIVDATCALILEKLPNVIRFFYWNDEELWFLETLENLNLIQRTPKLRNFQVRISEISGNFSSSLFVQFMLQNGHPNSTFRFIFNEPNRHLEISRMELIVEFYNWKVDNRDVFNVWYNRIEDDDVEVRFA